MLFKNTIAVQGAAPDSKDSLYIDKCQYVEQVYWFKSLKKAPGTAEN